MDEDSAGARTRSLLLRLPRLAGAGGDVGRTRRGEVGVYRGHGPHRHPHPADTPSRYDQLQDAHCFTSAGRDRIGT